MRFTHCSSCGKQTRVTVMKVEVRKHERGAVTLRYCPACASGREQAMQAIRERRERCA